ncbi:probable pectate lyase 5 [Cryptomeria japonica]|uniref:probable pectate lyase 5 n=1 Tax=Cryptomeria japonica TaxID=3369 RepID=UPI0027DA61E8|nr:probable pectate lyase 5 [Cryptomeria japonica]
MELSPSKAAINRELVVHEHHNCESPIELQMRMQMERDLSYIIVIGTLCFQVLIPKSSAIRTFEIVNNLEQHRTEHKSSSVKTFGIFNDLEQHRSRNKSSSVDDPELVVEMVQRSITDSRRQLSYVNCGTGNPIDDCWRCDPNWQMNRQTLADCAIGFGRGAQGGKNGQYYLITDSSDNDPVNPTPGTLRHAVIQTEPLWIIFQSDMFIQLKEELIMNSYKTIDGRGANIHIAHGPCITIHDVTNIIIHGVHIHDCIPAGNAMIRDTPVHYGYHGVCDGDGISISSSSFIWIDHCELYNCADGLIDATLGSTAITISNNYLHHHNKVMLLGHSDSYTGDVIMQVTIAFNHFGEDLVQRMPRCRHGYFHVVNNDFTHWEMYAIGGSAKPTINSQGNRYSAPSDPNSKQVTKRLDAEDSEWMNWNWRSDGDLMLNGAVFVPSGAVAADSYIYASSLGAKPSLLVGTLTADAGVLQDGVKTGSGSTGLASTTGVGGRNTVSGAEALSPFHCTIFYITLCVFLCSVLILAGEDTALKMSGSRKIGFHIECDIAFKRTES